MCALPACHRIDLEALRRQLQANQLQPADEGKLGELWIMGELARSAVVAAEAGAGASSTAGLRAVAVVIAAKTNRAERCSLRRKRSSGRRPRIPPAGGR